MLTGQKFRRSFSDHVMMNLSRFFASCLIIFSVLLLAFSMIFHCQPSDLPRFIGVAIAARIETDQVSPNVTTVDSEEPGDRFLGGLLAEGFDEDACQSRYQSRLYRKPSPYDLSQYLISKLRSYEVLHKRCGPGTEAYKRTLEQLDHEHASGSGECKYAVWVPFNGLGNKILSLASVFLYALLTDRVLLVDRGQVIDDLFCEPFPGTSWILPLDFPLRDRFHSLNKQSPRCYGNMLQNQTIHSSTEAIPSFLYIHIVHDYRDQDKLFFCEGDDALIHRSPWFVFRADQYFIPSLWMVPGFEDELTKLFPQKETVFHHLGRYLFHPTNQVWGLVTRYYETYLSTADERIGIQIRTFEGKGPFQHVMDQIVACARREELLPEVDTNATKVTTRERPKRKAVLVTSLSPWYSENLQSMYWERSSSTGDKIGIYQPSHEGSQQTGKKLHDQKALAEMYLLSMSDKLVTSGWSTFGYVAQGLAGLKPWILYMPKNHTSPDPPCVRAMSVEPCFHFPPFYDCKDKRGADTGKIKPYVRHCEDWSIGLRLFDSSDEL